MKLAVGWPWDSPFNFTCFTESALNISAPAECDMRWFRGKGWCSAARHVDILEQAVEWGAEYVCFLGSDQIHPEDLLIQLMDRVHQGYPVISAMVPMRGYVAGQDSKPFQPMAWRRDPETKKFIPINPLDGSVQSIDIIGSGVFMFPTHLLTRLQKPWFRDVVLKDTLKRPFPDDSLFVWRLRSELGVDVYVDTTIKVKHANVFPIDETYSDRFADWISGGGDPILCRYKETQNVTEG